MNAVNTIKTVEKIEEHNPIGTSVVMGASHCPRGSGPSVQEVE